MLRKYILIIHILESRKPLGAAPTTLNQLGGQQTSVNTSLSSPGSISYISLSAGSWILFGNLYFPTNTFRELSISATTSVDVNSTNGGSGASSVSHSRYVFVASGNQTYFLVAASTPAVSCLNPIFYAIRVG